MSWTVETYSGEKMTGPAGSYRASLFELCRAVNERQAAVGVTESVFVNTAGAPKANVTFSEMLGLKISGAVEGYRVNLNQIQTAITSMLSAGLFTQTSGYSDAWTVASMEAEIGTSLTLDPEKPNDTRFLQAQKDALDLMIYARRTDTVSAAHQIGYAYIPEAGVVDYTSLSSVWSHTINRARTTPALLLKESYYGMSGKNGGGFYSPAYWQEKCTGLETNTSAYSGALVAVRLNHTYRQNATGALSSLIGFSTGSTFHDSPVFAGISRSESIAGAVGDFTFPGITYIDLVGDDTSPCPLAVDTGELFENGFGAFFGCKFDSVTSYFSIADELTDQI